MAKEILGADLGGESLSSEELAAIPAFAGIRKETWDKFPGAIAKKVYQPGEIIIREGENGTTAFFILSGDIDLYLDHPVLRTQTRQVQRSFFKGITKFTQYLKGVPERPEKGAPRRTHIPQDASVDLPIENPIAVVTAGDLIGELAALAALKQERLKRPKFYPRSATARAKTEVVVLEMLPNILNNVLYNTPAFKDKLNRNYRTRALDTHLRTVPVFQDLSPEFLNHLRERVELVDVQPGETIVRQGDVADAFYLIRMGFVKVSQHFAGGEMVLTYLSRGSYFGEMGLLPPAFQVRAKGPEPGQIAEGVVSNLPVICGRAPTAERSLRTPWDEYISREHFEMRVEGGKVRVSRLPSGRNPLNFRMKPADSFLVSTGETFLAGETTFELLEDPLQAGRRTATCTAIDFVQLVRIKGEDFSLMMQQFPEIETGITEVARARRQADVQMLNRVQTISVNDFLTQELMQGQNLLLLDLDRCTRCDECVKACVATHDDGVTRLIRDGLRFDHYLVPTSCRACMDPLCMTRCPVGAIRRKDTLDIVIEDWCIGCGNCGADCPYGTINVVNLQVGGARKAQVEQRPKAVVCDLCVEYAEPNCVRACPHDAAIRVDPRTFFARGLAGLQLAVPTSVPAGPREPPPPQAPPVDGETIFLSNAADLLPMLPHLRITAGPRTGTVLQLRFPATTFGRVPENDYPFPDDEKMSRFHAKIVSESGKHLLCDLDSTNGTVVNGNSISEVELHSGDVIEMGDFQAEFLIGLQS
ncbi:MAG TPA: cyclic nucleotide-binding domain-containing protein [Bryobacteraceae bacterium]|jgi:CRP-like cAMP-binding protein/Fe-S-cluster-containing hydrogenase component 2|nr:cyclic nucleotide-binding domain-containing protein [Bryobacteraceae bacterium]